MIKNDPNPNFDRIFARRPDLEPPGYKNAVAGAVKAQEEKAKMAEEIRASKSKR